jgi:hypothetical protein
MMKKKTPLIVFGLLVIAFVLAFYVYPRSDYRFPADERACRQLLREETNIAADTPLEEICEVKILGMRIPKQKMKAIENGQGWDGDLELEHGKLRGNELVVFEKLPRLEHLMVFDYQNFDDSFAVALKAMPQLKSLSLVNTSVTNETVREIATLESLASIRLEQAQYFVDKNEEKTTRHDVTANEPWTDETLELLSRCHNLTEIRLCGSSEITNDGLRHLEKIPNLQSLMIVNTHKITWDGIRYLQTLPQLKSIFIDARSGQGSFTTHSFEEDGKEITFREHVDYPPPNTTDHVF